MTSGDKKLRIAVIGLGTIGPRHAVCIRENKDTELVAIVDPKPQPAAAAEYTKLGIPFYTSIAELLESQHRPDAAIICTPNHLHAQAACELADADVHILVEKPLCTNVKTGRELVDHLKVARDRGVKAIVGHHRRSNPHAVAAAEAIKAGSLGRVIGINGLLMVMKPPKYFDADWKQTKNAGPFLINLIHDIDLFHFFLGQVVRVHAEKTIAQRGFEAEEGAGIVFKFASGVIGTFLLCDNVTSPYGWDLGAGDDALFPCSGQDVYRIFGTDATLSMLDMTRWSYDGQPERSREEIIVPEKLCVEPGDPFALQLAHFVRVVKNGEEPRCTPEAGLAALIVCEAVLKSLETGMPVDISPYEL